MNDLVDFLCARLDEDEQTARAAIADDGGQDGGFEDATWLTGGSTRPGYGYAAAQMIRTFAVPRRVLREVEAKRRVLKRHAGCGTGAGFCDDGGHDLGDLGCSELLDLAAPYSAHPDYREEWAPVSH